MRIAVIDHSYHRKTNSSKFFLDLLSDLGTFRIFYDESWCGKAADWLGEFDEADYDLVIVWQVHEALGRLSGRHGNVVFVPMYDAMCFDWGFFWREEFNVVKVLSFSRKLHEVVRRSGAISKHLQYFPRPAEGNISTDFATIRPFFWYRKPPIIPQLAIHLCREAAVEPLWLHNAPDPGAPPIDFTHIPAGAIKRVTTWFESVEQFREALGSCNVFFAPRDVEGIGMSFLEAMSQGLCVVAPNTSTMNEYIANGTNGLLYCFGQQAALDFSRIREIGARARESVERGFLRWEDSKAELLEFLATPKEQLGLRQHKPVPLKCSRERSVSSVEEKVSVVTVCLNAAQGIRITIESVLSQDWQNCEYIIIDGGSSDGTLAVIEEYDAKLAYWHSCPDAGVYYAMNDAIDCCHGDWIIFMNAGDTFTAPDSLRRLLTGLPPQTDIVYGHHLYVPADGIEQYHPAADFETTWHRLLRGDLGSDWLMGIPGHQATAVRRRLLAELRFDTEYRISADHDFLFRARLNGASFFNSDELVSIYVGGGLSAQQYDRCKEEWATIARTYGDPSAADSFYYPQPIRQNGVDRHDAAEVDYPVDAELDHHADIELWIVNKRLAELLCSTAKALGPLARSVPALSKPVARMHRTGIEMWNRAEAKGR